MLGSGAGRYRRHDVIASVKKDMHEPLTALHALLEALESGAVPVPLRPPMRAHTRVLVRRLAALTDDLALVSELDPYTPRLVREDIDLRSVLAEAGALFPDIDVHLEAAAQLRVRADPTRLMQMLTNILRNASRRGPRPLFLYAAEEGRSMTLRVRDAGPRQGRELFIVNLLVRAHGGRTSHDAVSESFVVSMPRARAAVRLDPDLQPTA